MIKAVILDLDGTVYLGDKAVEGAASFVDFLRTIRLKVLFVTNRANRLPETIACQLNGMGISCSEADILTSSQATADCLEPSSAYTIGEDGLERALLDRGFTLTDKNVRYVIVSYDRSFNYDKLSTACNLIFNGAEFIATNPDKSLPLDGFLQPGTGAIVAAVAAGSGRNPRIIGKPEPLILESAARKLGIHPSDILALGDNVETDIPSAVRAGMKSAVILTGISSRKDLEKSSLKPDYTVSTYSDLTDIVKGLII